MMDMARSAIPPEIALALQHFWQMGKSCLLTKEHAVFVSQDNCRQVHNNGRIEPIMLRENDTQWLSGRGCKTDSRRFEGARQGCRTGLNMLGG